MTGRDILIVEDENIVALDIRMRLEAMGYRVLDVVDTSAAAIDRATELEPDLVLMDIKLKGDADGIETATKLRERSEVPVIFVTAFTDEKTLDRAKRASPYGYIVKPFHERELRIAIELALYKHQYEISIRRAKEIAEEANRVKGEFLTNMSHELKTPLNSVIGFTELALASAKESEQREQLTIALSSAKTLLNLIESILDFARMEAGKLSAAVAPFSLDSILDECVDSLSIAAYPKNLDVYFARDPAITDSLVGDGSLLKHILLDLIDNAVKFTDRGHIRIAATLYGEDCPGCGPTVEFEVADTGIGMAPDKIGTAFERFTQLDPSKTRKAGGTGLGLAIVAKSVELMKGTLSVESAAGQGTRFIIRIPFELGSYESSEPRSASLESAAVLGFDEQRFLDLKLVLARLGFLPQKVESLEAARMSGSRFIVADERAFDDVGDSDIVSFAYKLVIATRLGGSARIRLGKCPNVAFSALPLRSSGLRAAFASLARKATSSAPGAAKREEMDLEPKHKAGKIGSGPAKGEARSPITRLASFLEKAASTGSFSDAEREAKDMQDSLAQAGDIKGSRLAFAALLSARKRDVAALKLATAKLRESERKMHDNAEHGNETGEGI